VPLPGGRRGADRPHLQRVRDDHPGEAQLTAEQPGHGRGRQAGRQVPGQFRQPQVAGHDRRDARADRRLERRQVAPPQLGVGHSSTRPMPAIEGSSSRYGPSRCRRTNRPARPRHPRPGTGCPGPGWRAPARADQPGRPRCPSRAPAAGGVSHRRPGLAGPDAMSRSFRDARSVAPAGPCGPPGPGRRSPGPGGTGRLSTVSAIGRAQLSEPVLSTFCSWVLALLTVAVKLAPCISDFIIVGMI